LIRICLAPRVLYLTRSTPPSDQVTVELLRIDNIIASAVSSIRWTGPNEDPTIDHSLLTLPLRMGGLGLLSLIDISPHSYSAAQQSSSAFLYPLIPSIPLPDTMSSQHDRCAEMHLLNRQTLFQHLDDPLRLFVIENASVIGRRWLTAFPAFKSLRLTDADVSTALQVRTLSTTFFTICKACGQVRVPLSHADTCSATTSHRTRRHEVFKYALGRALSSAPGGRVDYEPLAFDTPTNTPKYNDIRFHGSIEADMGPLEFDTKVASLHSTSRPPLREIRALQIADDPVRSTELVALLHLRLVNTRARVNLNSPSTDGPFHPAVLSAGGLAESEFAQVLNNLKRKLPPGVLSIMLQSISIGLVRNRSLAISDIQGTSQPRPAHSLDRGLPVT
jgi:hypothetical protein